MDDAWRPEDGPSHSIEAIYNEPPAPVERRRQGRVKLVVEISPDLHQRIIAICGTRRVPVNQAVRNALEHAFPR